MPNYRRYRIPGGSYFFTVNLLQRHGNDLLIKEIDRFRDTILNVKQLRSFHIDAWVVLPDHMHCIWTLPPGDDDYTGRWRAIKAIFSRSLPHTERRSKVRIARGERGIWQRRFWEHAIRDNKDYSAHMDYIHYNPVKHGYVKQVVDWPLSTFRHWVDKGVYPIDWCGTEDELIDGGE